MKKGKGKAGTKRNDKMPLPALDGKNKKKQHKLPPTVAKKDNNNDSCGFESIIHLFKNNKSIAKEAKNGELCPQRMFIMAGATATQVEQIIDVLQLTTVRSSTIVEACKHGASKDVICCLAKRVRHLEMEKCLQVCSYIEDPAILRCLCRCADKNLDWDNQNKPKFLKELSKVLPYLTKLELDCCEPGITTHKLTQLLPAIFSQRKLHTFAVCGNGCLPSGPGKRYATYPVLEFIATEGNTSKSGIRKLTVDFPAGFDESYASLLLLGIKFLPSLSELTLYFDNLLDGIQTSAEIVALNKLKELKVLSLSDEISIYDACEWLPVLEAIKNDGLLKVLEIEGYFCQEWVLSTPLLQNTSLLSVDLGYTRDKCLVYGKFGNPIDDELKYHIVMNKARRGLAAQSYENGLSLAQFVDILSQFSSHNKGKKKKEIIEANATIIQYGVLREMPGFWSRNVGI